jgi:hypothetical protein
MLSGFPGDKPGIITGGKARRVTMRRRAKLSAMMVIFRQAWPFVAHPKNNPVVRVV